MENPQVRKFPMHTDKYYIPLIVYQVRGQHLFFRNCFNITVSSTLSSCSSSSKILIASKISG